MSKASDPTDAELGILAVLWQIGPATVRQVHETLYPDQDGPGYTTTLKFMQLMTQKGLLTRDESQRSHIYQPTSPAAHTQKNLLKKLIDVAFSGSAPALAMRALSVKPVSQNELNELRNLLDTIEESLSDE